jgi:hypothetical protein
MRIGLIGRAIARKASMASLGLLLAVTLAACTTVEGTNALTDAGTFEREVMSSTARGFGLIPGETPKEEPTQARAPLVLPRNAAGALPAPTTAAAVAQLPANSDAVRIDASGLSEADIARLRNAKVVDLRSLSGRPLTEAEARALTARMQAANVAVGVNGKRPLYLPPDEYFTRVGNADLVCRNPAGQIVALSDPSCPDEVRRALRSAGPTGSGMLGGAIDSEINDMKKSD